MAVFKATFCTVMGAGAPVYAPAERAAETIATSASSQALTTQARGGEYVTLSATGGSVHIKIGQGTPTAVASAGYHIMDGTSKDFGPLQDGDRVAVIDA